jgi:hypothetical protein
MVTKAHQQLQFDPYGGGSHVPSPRSLYLRIPLYSSLNQLDILELY